MSRTLTKTELEDLYNRYNSEKRKLQFQLQHLNSTIAGLKDSIKEAKTSEESIVSASTPKKTTKRRGRPAKAKTAASPTKSTGRRGRPKKAVTSTKAAEAPKSTRRPGRPKKTTTSARPAPAKSTRGRGRPKKTESTAVTTAPVKKTTGKRGRPAKAKTAASAKPAKTTAKRGPGRPKASKTKALAPAAAPKRRGRPAKAKTAAPATPAKTTGKRGRPKKSTTTAAKATPAAAVRKPSKKASAASGYKLSDWDTALLEILSANGKAMITNDLLSAMKSKMKGSSAAEVKGKLTRSIHKLANKRDELKKVKFEGRGFAYALKEWVTNRGNLKPEYS